MKILSAEVFFKIKMVSGFSFTNLKPLTIGIGNKVFVACVFVIISFLETTSYSFGVSTTSIFSNSSTFLKFIFPLSDDNASLKVFV